jgi:hypothetical protein
LPLFDEPKWALPSNALTTLIDQLRNKLDAYNTALSVLDSYQSEICLMEKDLNSLSEQMLIGVAFKYGNDSREYEMAGGLRKSERIRRSTNSRLKAGANRLAVASA